MRAVLVILKKDVRRLSWQIGIALALSASLGCLDARRSDPSPGVPEALLTPLLLLAWACLIAQVVHEEPLVGDREFWMTRPYRWPQLLAAKAIFVALVVHVPLFLTDVAILAARGFSPLQALPNLLWRQILLAGALTLPTIAVASVVSGPMQFVFVGLTTAVIVSVATSVRSSHIHGPDVPPYAAIAVLALAALPPIVLLQYWRRWTGLARVWVVAGGLAAALLIALPPLPYAAAFPPQIHANIALAPGKIQLFHYGGLNRVGVLIPVIESGLLGLGWPVQYVQSIEVEGANGVRYTSPGPDFFASHSLAPSGESSISLSFANPGIYDRIKNGKVTISGRIAVTFVDFGHEVRMPLGANLEVPGIGGCSTRTEEGRSLNGLPNEFVTVLCESPSGKPMGGFVRVEWPVPGRPRSQEADLESTSRNPPEIPLAPLRRRKVWFQVVDPASPRTPWTIPREALPSAQIVVVPRRFKGRTRFDFQLSNVDLPDYPRNPAGR